MTSVESLQLNTVHEATPSEVDAFRRPEQIYTDGYLASPIQYSTDPRFVPMTVTAQLASMPDSLQRDFAAAVQVNINTEERQGFPISMHSPTWSRTKYNKVIGPRVGFNYF